MVFLCLYFCLHYSLFCHGQSMLPSAEAISCSECVLLEDIRITVFHVRPVVWLSVWRLAVHCNLCNSVWSSGMSFLTIHGKHVTEASVAQCTHQNMSVYVMQHCTRICHVMFESVARNMWASWATTIGDFLCQLFLLP